MKKIVVVSLALVMLSAMSFAVVRGDGAVSNCPGALKRTASGAFKGGLVGAGIGALTDGSKGARNIGLGGVGVGAVVGLLMKSDDCKPPRNAMKRVRASEVQGNRRGPVDSADQVTKTEGKGLIPVYIEQFNGGDPNILQGLLAEALDARRYKVIPMNRPPNRNNPAVYFMTVSVVQKTGANNGSFGNVSGPRGYISGNRNDCTGSFYVTITTSHLDPDDGTFYVVPGLSRNRISMTGVCHNASINAGTRIGATSVNGGGYTNEYAVNPMTDAAQKAIAHIFNYESF